MAERVYCLYRVSTDKQVDYNDKSQADIPMQRRECHRFCEKMGWTIVHEEQEDGVSGHKVRAENRDKIQTIKELAKQQSCIIIGKCANHLLRDYDNTVSVYIEAPRAFCVKNVIERLGVTEEEAHRMIHQTDRYRADYYKYYTGGETQTNPVLYDMTLNSDRMGMDKCTELIIQYLKIKLGEDILGKKGTAENDKALKQLGLFQVKKLNITTMKLVYLSRENTLQSREPIFLLHLVWKSKMNWRKTL